MRGRCIKSVFVRWYFDSEKADKHRDFCSWKPICGTCGGTGKYNTHPDNILEDIPCPTCQTQEETLLVPVRWVKYGGSNDWQLETHSSCLARIMWQRNTKPHKYRVQILGEFGEYFDTPEQAQAAVTRALGMRKG
jgi:hypothetical protein